MASTLSSVPSSALPPAGTSTGPAPIADPPLAERGTTLHETVRSASWSARGVTKVVGSVDIGRGELEGFVVVGGALSADHLSVRGTLEVLGTLTVREELSVHGTLHVGAAVHAGEAAVSGSVRADGPVTIERRLVGRGGLSAPAVTALEIHLGGTVRVPGELRAGTIDIELADGSELGVVVGRTVRLVGPEGGMVDRLLGRFRRARITRVEAEAAELDRVEARTVVGREVLLGRETHVVLLDAATLRAHPTSRVGPESRSPPPRGLRR